MKVVLLSHTPDPERVCATAARNCYSPRDITSIQEGWTPEAIVKMIDRIRDTKHLSVFEHCQFSFGIEGVSRSLTHQLVRHRHLSFEQQSQRYLKASDPLPHVTPPSLRGSPLYDTCMDTLSHVYAALIREGVPAEDARYILPNSVHTQIIVTGNARALMDFFTLRTCNNAQWEIRELAMRMQKLCKAQAPNIFKTSGATCVRGYCDEANGPQCPRYKQMVKKGATD